MKIKKILLLLIVCNSITIFAQSLLDAPVPKRYVNDFANIFSTNELNYLEKRIHEFDKSSSNQFAIITIKSLEGYEPSDFAYKLAEKWGVGQKLKNNGVLILVKPKTGNEKGQVYIAVGYGLEGAIPDIMAKRIIENTMIPYFKEDNYFSGIDVALSKLFSLSKNEYTNEAFGLLQTEILAIIILAIITLLLPILYLIYVRNKKTPERYSHYYVKDRYNLMNLLEQVNKIEKLQNTNYPKFKAILSKYDNLSKHNLFKYEGRIDDKMFCILLNGRKRMQAFNETADPFLLSIILYFVVLIIIVSVGLYIHINILASLIGLFVSLLVTFGMLSFLSSFIQIYQFALRKKNISSGGISIALFLLNALFKRNIKRSYDPMTRSYIYFPTAVAYSSGGGFGAGGSFGGGGFGGGSFGGGGAVGSW